MQQVNSCGRWHFLSHTMGAWRDMEFPSPETDLDYRSILGEVDHYF